MFIKISLDYEAAQKTFLIIRSGSASLKTKYRLWINVGKNVYKFKTGLCNCGKKYCGKRGTEIEKGVLIHICGYLLWICTQKKNGINKGKMLPECVYIVRIVEK